LFKSQAPGADSYRLSHVGDSIGLQIEIRFVAAGNDDRGSGQTAGASREELAAA
jgi:hypothetical protein